MKENLLEILLNFSFFFKSNFPGLAKVIIGSEQCCECWALIRVTWLQETNSPGQQGSPLSVAPLSHATPCDEGNLINDNLPSNQPVDDAWVDEGTDYEVTI